jgi:hypothetical protein
MFYGCTSLTTAPELPATTLVNKCYCVMFYNCRKLKTIKCYATAIEEDTKSDNVFSYPAYQPSHWTTGVAYGGTLVCKRSFANTLKKYIPDSWTIEYLD